MTLIHYNQQRVYRRTAVTYPLNVFTYNVFIFSTFWHPDTKHQPRATVYRNDDDLSAYRVLGMNGLACDIYCDLANNGMVGRLRAVSRGGGVPGTPLIDIQEKNLIAEKYCCNCRKTSNSLGTQENRVGISIKWNY